MSTHANQITHRRCLQHIFVQYDIHSLLSLQRSKYQVIGLCWLPMTYHCGVFVVWYMYIVQIYVFHRFYDEYPYISSFIQFVMCKVNHPHKLPMDNTNDRILCSDRQMITANFTYSSFFDPSRYKCFWAAFPVESRA